MGPNGLGGVRVGAGTAGTVCVVARGFDGMAG